MILENQTVVIQWTGRNRKKYEELGYVFTKFGNPLEIKVEHLHKGSHEEVWYECDNCHKKDKREYRKLFKQDIHYCKKCCTIRREETCMKLYGVKNTFQSEEKKEKIKQTCIKKYGVDSPLKNKEIHDKVEATCMKKYGVRNTFQVKEFQEKSRQTILERYGEDYYKEKALTMIRTLNNKNSSTRTSNNQANICEWTNGTLNYKISRYSLDIRINDKLYIEYDGSGHTLPVILKQVSKKVFKKKELYRNKYMENLGYKLIRVINRQDIDLDKDEFLKLYNFCTDYLKNTDYKWIKIYYDKRLVISNIFKKTFDEVINNE